jgi:hypothetical protein
MIPISIEILFYSDEVLYLKKTNKTLKKTMSFVVYFLYSISSLFAYSQSLQFCILYSVQYLQFYCRTLDCRQIFKITWVC